MQGLKTVDGISEKQLRDGVANLELEPMVAWGKNIHHDHSELFPGLPPPGHGTSLDRDTPPLQLLVAITGDLLKLVHFSLTSGSYLSTYGLRKRAIGI